jgi:hypothetical protein
MDIQCSTSIFLKMMAALVISIGFSVDIPAHVSYHYHASSKAHNSQRIYNYFTSGHKHPELSIEQRLALVLSSVGVPAIQASISTSICVLSMLFVPLYMAHIFVRIMCSCILLCVVHSVVVLPALFYLTEKLINIFKCYKN